MACLCCLFCSSGVIEDKDSEEKDSDERIVAVPCGDGATSRVYVEHIRNADAVAVKVYRTGIVAWHEVNILRRLERHPCLPSLLDVGEDRIVMTFAGSQCLVDWLLYPTSRADRTGCDRIARDVASALGHMHDRRIAHLDVKPDNIVINTSGRATLVDFDLSHVYRHGESEYSLQCHRGSPAYVPPEMVWRREDISGFRADAWSYGVVMVALCYRRLPFQSASPPCELFARYMGLVSLSTPFAALCQLHPMFAERGHVEYQPVFDVTLRRDPRHRATFSEILSMLPDNL